MKTSHIFWGILFIVSGLLVLINNFTTIFMDWSTIWKLWPVAVILIGLSIIIKHKYGKGVVAGLAALVLAFAIFASFKTAVHLANNDFEITFGDEGDYSFETQEYTEQFDSTLKYATLNFDAGAGSFNISKTTENLFYALTEGRKDNYSLSRYDSDSSSQIDFSMENSGIRIGISKYKNKVDMALNPALIWDMNFDVGAASMDFDLSEIKTNDITVDMGAASIKIKLGERYPETNLNIDAGASDIDIFVPEKSGCRISTEGALSSKNFEEFEKINSGRYETSNFAAAENKIYIDIESGVSSITVKRY